MPVVALSEQERQEVSSLPEFLSKPEEVSLEVWAAVGAKYRRRCRRGTQQAQAIARALQSRIDSGEVPATLLLSRDSAYADTSVRSQENTCEAFPA